MGTACGVTLRERQALSAGGELGEPGDAALLAPGARGHCWDLWFPLRAAAPTSVPLVKCERVWLSPRTVH